MKRFFIFTFGCQMNKSDSERITSILEKLKYKPASKVSEADLIIVNMCSVRQSAVDRIYGKINEINKLKKERKIKTILTGCIPQRDLKNFRTKFDYILHIKSLKYWKDFLEERKYFYCPSPRNKNLIKELADEYLKIKSSYSNFFSVFIPISTGCDNFCTFCIVPYTRGQLTNRDHKEIIGEAKEAIKNGAKEIWFLGQNINSYKSPSNSSVDFSKLLELTNKIKGKFWIRFTSSNPKDFSNKLIKTMANCNKVTEYLNLPIQSGDNKILKRMNRAYTAKQYKDLVKQIRKEISNISLSTDAIVGFPGETKAQFQNTEKLFKEIKFDMAYIAQYSPRSGTVAAKMKNNVSIQEKDRREKTLTRILKKTALENNKKYIGKTIEVLVEKSKNDFLTGKSRTYKTVRFKGSKNLIGKFTKVKIIDALSWGLKGKYDKIN